MVRDSEAPWIPFRSAECEKSSARFRADTKLRRFDRQCETQNFFALRQIRFSDRRARRVRLIHRTADAPGSMAMVGDVFQEGAVHL